MIVLILLLAAFLRLYRIDVLMRFIWDEGRDMLAIRNIIVNHDLTLFGPFNEIAGHKDFFGVFHYYLMLPSLWLSNFDPVGPAIFTAMLGVITIWLLYYWLRNFTESKTALTVTAIMAISPLVVRFNQWPWNPNTVGFFAILYLIAVQKYQTSYHRCWAAFAGFALGLLFQLHYFTIALGGIALLIFMKQRKKDWLSAILFCSAFILPNLTFVIFDLTHAGLYRQIIWQSFFGGNGQKFVTFSFSNFLLGPFKYIFDLSSKFLGSKVLGFGLSFAFLSYLWQTFSELKNNKNEKVNENAQVTIAWCFFLLMTSFFPSLLDDYHSAALWSGLALALVVVLQKIFKQKWIVVFSLLSVWLVYSNHFWRQPTWQENMPRLRQAAMAVAEDAKLQKNEKINLASFVDPETRGIRFRYFVINDGQNLLGFDDYPRSEILYAISPHSWEETIQNPAWELDTFRQASSATTVWSDGDWTVFRVSK